MNIDDATPVMDIFNHYVEYSYATYPEKNYLMPFSKRYFSSPGLRVTPGLLLSVRKMSSQALPCFVLIVLYPPSRLPLKYLTSSSKT